MLGIFAGIAAHMFALAIPQFLRDLVNSLVAGGVDALIPAVGFIVLLGVMEAGFVLLRRWLVLTPGTHVEAGMRNTLYEKLQDLPVAFHDRWPSGQLLSRAVSDLHLIRRWMSFGLVLFVANFITIVAGLFILFTFSFWLGLFSLSPPFRSGSPGSPSRPNTRSSQGSRKISPEILRPGLRKLFTESGF